MSDGTNFDYFKQENGINRLPAHKIKTSTTESPFDYKNHTRLFIPGDMPLPDNQSEEYRRAIADKIIELVKATNGHTAILFTSYSVLQSVYEMTKDALSDYQLICMTRSNKSAIPYDASRMIHPSLSNPRFRVPRHLIVLLYNLLHLRYEQYDKTTLPNARSQKFGTF